MTPLKAAAAASSGVRPGAGLLRHHSTTDAAIASSASTTANALRRRRTAPSSISSRSRSNTALPQGHRCAALLLASLCGVHERHDLQGLFVGYRGLARLEELDD